MKPTTIMDTILPSTEQRPWKQQGATQKEMGRSSITIPCPFCNTCLTVYLWSLHGKGKRCSCGALLRKNQVAYKAAEPEKGKP